MREVERPKRPSHAWPHRQQRITSTSRIDIFECRCFWCVFLASAAVILPSYCINSLSSYCQHHRIDPWTPIWPKLRTCGCIGINNRTTTTTTTTTTTSTIITIALCFILYLANFCIDIHVHVCQARLVLAINRVRSDIYWLQRECCC